MHMADYFIRNSGNPGDFYLYDHKRLIDDINSVSGNRILLGVSYALLDLASKYSFDNADDIIIMETGGMKGRKSEMNRSELHKILKSKFNVPSPGLSGIQLVVTGSVGFPVHVVPSLPI